MKTTWEVVFDFRVGGRTARHIQAEGSFDASKQADRLERKLARKLGDQVLSRMVCEVRK